MSGPEKTKAPSFVTAVFSCCPIADTAFKALITTMPHSVTQDLHNTKNSSWNFSWKRRQRPVRHCLRLSLKPSRLSIGISRDKERTLHSHEVALPRRINSGS